MTATVDAVDADTFLLPDLGEGLVEAELVRWLVAVGDTVAVDAPVAEVETAKVAVEIPAPVAGVVTGLHAQAGDTVQVGAPLITVSPQPRSAPETGNVLVGYGPSAPPEPGRRRRSAGAGTAAAAAGRKPAGRPAVASPLVRKLAKQHGLQPASITGTGPGGLITRGDVERAAAERATAAVDARTGLPIGARIPLQGLRKAVADTLGRSRREIPEATIWVDVDATALLDARGKQQDRSGPGLLAVLARFVVAGLARFPELNSRVDTETGEIIQLSGVNLGIATQTDRGLVVPVVRDAHTLTARGLDTQIRRVTAAARDGSAKPAELGTGSFTLNNYGRFGVDGSAAIINHPEVAILGLGRIIARPWVVDGQIVPRQIGQLSLVFDHRVCDGAAASGLVRFVVDAIESPWTALAEL